MVRTSAWFGLCGLWAVGVGVGAAEIEGFTEPYRAVQVATSEIGIVVKLQVKEGDTVRRDQPVAQLDHDVQSAILAVAEQYVALKGQTASARAEFQLRKTRLEKLIELSQRGHARQEEIERAQADLDIAAARVVTAEEEIAIRRLEREKASIQLQRRTIVAPLDGIVSIVHKDEGEFVNVSDPSLVTIVQLNRLLAVFSVPGEHAAPLVPGATATVRLVGAPQVLTGEVEFVAPVTDAESGTVRVKVRLENPQNRYRSGQRCVLVVPGGTTPVSAPAKPANKT